MKTKLYIWIGLVTFAVAVGAATLTINIGNSGPRIGAAYGKLLDLRDANGNPRDATTQEVSDYLRAELISNVYAYESRKNAALYSPTPLDFVPTPTPTPTATPTPTGTPTP